MNRTRIERGMLLGFRGHYYTVLKPPWTGLKFYHVEVFSHSLNRRRFLCSAIQANEVLDPSESTSFVRVFDLIPVTGVERE
jgi:hypothetical protein